VTRGKFQGALRIKDVRVAIARSLSLFQKRRRASRAAAVQDASDIKRFGMAVSELLTPSAWLRRGRPQASPPMGAREACRRSQSDAGLFFK
jgi:hypothetical protein